MLEFLFFSITFLVSNSHIYHYSIKLIDIYRLLLFLPKLSERPLVQPQDYKIIALDLMHAYNEALRQTNWIQYLDLCLAWFPLRQYSMPQAEWSQYKYDLIRVNMIDLVRFDRENVQMYLERRIKRLDNEQIKCSEEAMEAARKALNPTFYENLSKYFFNIMSACDLMSSYAILNATDLINRLENYLYSVEYRCNAWHCSWEFLRDFCNLLKIKKAGWNRYRGGMLTPLIIHKLLENQSTTEKYFKLYFPTFQKVAFDIFL